MQIHLSEIIDSEGKVIQITPELELDTISFQLGKYPILDKTPVKLTIANTGKCVWTCVDACMFDDWRFKNKSGQGCSFFSD